MAAAPYILARTFADAHAFARGDLGLLHGQYRVVTSAGTLKAVRGATLHLVPGWERRFDRFQMKAALRWTYMTVIDHSEDPAEAPEPVLDGLNPPGVQTELTDGADPALVEQFEAFLNGGDHPHEEPVSSNEDIQEMSSNEDTSNGDNMTSEGGPAVPEEPPAEAPEAPVEDKRRRRRCKECGLLVDPDEVDAHAAEHLPDGD